MAPELLLERGAQRGQVELGERAGAAGAGQGDDEVVDRAEVGGQRGDRGGVGGVELVAGAGSLAAT